MPLKDLPQDSQPREKLLARGPSALTDAELLAIVLRTGMAGKSVLQWADELLAPPSTGTGSFGGLAANPLQVLVTALSTIKDASGRITLPGFYDGVEDLSPELRADWEALGFDAGDFLSRVGLRSKMQRFGLEG